MPHDYVLKVRHLALVIVCLACISQVRADTLHSAPPDSAEPAPSSPAAWSEPAPVSSSDVPSDSLNPDMAVCDDGTVYIVWEQDGKIWYRVRYPSSEWGAARRVSFPETGQTASGSEPAIAVGPDCVVHLVWSNLWWDTYEIFYSVNEGDGFLAPARVSRTDTGQSSQPAIAVDSGGEAHVVWVDTVSGGYQLYEGWPIPSYSGDYSGNWGKLPVRGADNQVQVPGLAIDHNDELHVTWMKQSGFSDIYYKRPRYWDASVIENLSVSPNAFSRLPDIEISLDKVVVVWQETVNGDDEIFVSWRRLGGLENFTSTNNLSATDASSRAPAVSVDRGGKFSVAWDEGGATDAILTRFWSGNGGWWDTQPASRDGKGVKEPAIAASPRDDGVHVVWSQKDGSDDTWDIYFSDIQFVTNRFYLMLVMNNHE